MREFDVLIIGAGSAGLMCASRLCFLAKKFGSDLKIGVIDSNNRIGRKLAITGNGKCNLTNSDIDISLYNSDDFSKLRKIVESFDYESTIDFFSNELGLITTQKDELTYPQTEKSSSVIDAFRMYLVDNGVEIILEEKISNAIKRDLFECDSKSEKIVSKCLVIATGGASFPNTGSDGNGYKLLSRFINRSEFTPVSPALVQLTSNDKDLTVLSGMRFHCCISLFEDGDEISSEEGEILFTDYGLSGICVMQLSRYIAQHKYFVIIDILSDYTNEYIVNYLRSRASCVSNRSIVKVLMGITLREFAEVILNRSNINPETPIASLSSSDYRKIARNIKSLKVQITGKESFDKAQVTKGGLNMNAVTDNLESVDNDGLFVCGEVLNVDGPCGGYNLQWAWSSADAVANGIMRRLYGI